MLCSLQGHQLFKQLLQNELSMNSEQIVTLDRLPSNAVAIIQAVRGEGALQQRFFDMGFIPGAQIEKVCSAPLLDPIEVRIMDYAVSLRRQEARMVEVRIVHD